MAASMPAQSVGRHGLPRGYAVRLRQPMVSRWCPIKAARTARRTTTCYFTEAPHSSCSRRELIAGASLVLALLVAPAAHALTLAEATPAITPAPGPLPPQEQQLIALFAQAEPGVVNVVDLALAAAGPSRQSSDLAVPEGNGSGVVWDTDGHIVTNFHVLAASLNSGSAKPGKSIARVTLLGADGQSQSLMGVLVGVDRAHDIAVIQIAAPPEVLRPLPLGTSSDLQVGQTAYAIGFPFGFDWSLSAGIVSGVNREIQSSTTNIIGGGVQVDAAINPGNSGGALVDSRGRLIGLNTAIFTSTGSSVGVGFAIPVDTVARVVNEIIAFGRVVRPELGCTFATDKIRNQLGAVKGALVLSVEPESAAEKAGLRPTVRGLSGIVPGDSIIAVDGQIVTKSTDVFKALDGRRAGDRVILRVQRPGSEPLELTAELQGI